MEMDEERKARLEKMVVTTQLRIALETEEERRAKRNGFDFRFDFKNTYFFQGMSSLALMGTIFLVGERAKRVRRYLVMSMES